MERRHSRTLTLVFGSKEKTPARQHAEDGALLALMTISQLFVDARAYIASEPTEELEATARELDDAEAYIETATSTRSGAEEDDLQFGAAVGGELETVESRVQPDVRSRSGGSLKRVGSSPKFQKLAETAQRQAAVVKAQEAIARSQSVYEKTQNKVAKAQEMRDSAQAIIASAQIRLTERWSKTMHPANPAWDSLSAQERVNWWYRRLAPAAAMVAATPAVAGRLGVKSQVGELLGAASEAVLISAIAYEAGVVDPVRHSQVSAQLLLKRQVSEQELTALVDRVRARVQEVRTDPLSELSGLPSRVVSVRLVWQSAKEMSEIADLLKHRPRGNFLARAVKNVPIAGAGGAFVAELGGLRKTVKLAVREFS